jgi:mannose-6-phosphate isomerase-like protein (cupin superfamily)
METHDPIHRATFSFSRDGDTLRVETWLDDGGHLPEHFHPTLDETWQALEGTVRVKLAGTWRELSPEDGVVPVPRHTRHELVNASGRRVHLLGTATPPGGLQEFLTESARAAQDGLYNARNLPRSWRGAMWIADFAYRFRDETVVCSPPPALQRAVLPVGARLRGTAARRRSLAARR